MHLVLGLPGFLAGPSLSPLPPLSGLARLLHAGGTPVVTAAALPQALAERYGVVRDGDWPLAALRLRAFGHDPGSDWWLAADPVTLVAGRDDVRVTGPVTDLTAAEAAALVARLNAHFAADGLRFVAATPRHWFVGSRRPYAISTQPLAAAVDRPLRELLPQGPDRALWRRWQNEIEMLLHDHPVNRERESLARGVANGLWFGDGGTLPAPTRPLPGRMTFADDDAVRALALHAGEAHAAAVASLGAARRAGASATELVAVVAAGADPATVERAWAGPAWRALGAGTLTRVTLLADGGGRTARWDIARPGPLARIRARFSTPSLAALLAPVRQDD